MREELELNGTAVLPVNCEQLRKDDVFAHRADLLYEFPVARMEFYSEMDGNARLDHPMKREIIQSARTILGGMQRERYYGTGFYVY